MRKLPPRPLEVIGFTLIGFGLLALAIVTTRELLTWYQTALPHHRQYIVQRVVYVLATTTDLPVVQVLLAGIVLRLGARRKRRVLLSEAQPRPDERVLKEAEAPLASGSR